MNQNYEKAKLISNLLDVYILV